MVPLTVSRNLLLAVWQHKERGGARVERLGTTLLDRLMGSLAKVQIESFVGLIFNLHGTKPETQPRLRP